MTGPSGGDAVTVQRSGPVTTVRLSRPHVRNAVDGPTAAALADAFRAFDADPAASVAVLTGDGGTFCSAADLHAVGTADGNRTEPDGDGPMGAHQAPAGQAGRRGDQRPRGGGRARARPLVRPAGGRGDSRARRLLPALGRSVVLTGRSVPAAEALVAAQLLAAEIARFPQTCLRGDRASLLEQA